MFLYICLVSWLCIAVALCTVKSSAHARIAGMDTIFIQHSALRIQHHATSRQLAIQELSSTD